MNWSDGFGTGSPHIMLKHMEPQNLHLPVAKLAISAALVQATTPQA
ncbi:hypothetical protein [Corynebacterium macginleyi]|nr:hypothetical protein [Corynebacterium macginleyi]MBK4162525.1 hypothetical protein [Corynebacterium macginleyi]